MNLLQDCILTFSFFQLWRIKLIKSDIYCVLQNIIYEINTKYQNKHIIMISEGSCDTEDWSNGCWKFSFSITEISYIVQYIIIENSYWEL